MSNQNRIVWHRTAGNLLCHLGIHRWDYTGNAHTFAPRAIRCERCEVKF